MSEQSASAKLAELFARKGSARPAGTLIHYERAVALRDARLAQDAKDAEASGDSKPGGDAPGTEGSQKELDLAAPAKTAPNKSATKKTAAKKDKTPKAEDLKEPVAGSLLTIRFRHRDRQPQGAQSDRSGLGAPPKVPLKKRGARISPPTAPLAKPQAPPASATPPTALASAATTPSIKHGPFFDSAQSAGRESWAAVALGALALIGVGLGLWYAMQDGRGVGDAAPPVSEAAAPPAGQAPTSESESAEPGPAPVESEAAAPPTSAEGGQDGQTAASQTVQPSFDLIRIEPDGEAVIAGRAAPNTELILLDNGEPIGKVTADWAGEWAFIPDQPLEVGDHKFSLVVGTPQGTVTIPAPDSGSDLEGAVDELKGAPPADAESEAPAESERQSSLDEPGASDGADPPKPSRKPEAAEGEPVYEVQLSSTTSRKGAELELDKLQRSFPVLLEDKVLFVQEAKIDEADTRFRIRTGPFADQDPARALCAEFRTRKQECLVVRR